MNQEKLQPSKTNQLKAQRIILRKLSFILLAQMKKDYNLYFHHIQLMQQDKIPTLKKSTSAKNILHAENHAESQLNQQQNKWMISLLQARLKEYRIKSEASHRGADNAWRQMKEFQKNGKIKQCNQSKQLWRQHFQTQKQFNAKIRQVQAKIANLFFAYIDLQNIKLTPSQI